MDPEPSHERGRSSLFCRQPDGICGETAKLGQDIALTKQWTPVDLYGTLDGQGHTISGLNVNMNGGLGAMCSIETGAALMNLTVEGEITYTANKKNTPAGLVGNLHGTMYNVTNKTTINASSSADLLYLGGIVGVQESGQTIDCINKGKIVVDAARSSGGVGGVVGFVYNCASLTTQVDQCRNEGQMEINTSNMMACGGVVGLLYDNTAAVEVTGCENASDITVAVVKKRGSSGMDGFYLGGIIGGINAANTSVNIQTVTSCRNSGAISAVTASSAGTSNAVKVGGICGNTRGLAVLERNENAGAVTLENTQADGSFCSVGGIVGEMGDPWNNEDINVTITGNVNNAAVLSKTNTAYSAAGGIIGCAFTPVTFNANKNTGTVERASTDGATPGLDACFAGGVVGLFWLSDAGRLNATFTGDMNFGTVKSIGRAGILFGGMYSKSYAQFAINDCVIGGHLTCGNNGYDSRQLG